MAAEGDKQSAAIAARLAGKKAIRSYARKLADPEDIKDLNITPMMDMMTIILVFLLKSFTSSATLVNLDNNLSLPPSQTRLAPKQAVPVTITKRVVLVEGEAVAPINAGRIDPQLKRDGDNGYYITPLVEMLSKVARREKKIAEMTGGKFDGELTIIADKNTPYRLLTEILYSCGQAEYANFRLLVLKNRE
jgi:biopolymer transport protein ExbD